MLRPRKTNFKKCRVGSFKFSPVNTIRFLDRFKKKHIRLCSLQYAKITETQLEACKQILNKKLKRSGKVQTKIFSNCPISKKPNEVRMGKGKGSIDSWGCSVSPGTTLFEIFGIKTKDLKYLNKASSALPIICFIS